MKTDMERENVRDRKRERGGGGGGDIKGRRERI